MKTELSQNTLENYRAFLLKVLPLAAFIVPMAAVYLLTPLTPL